MGENGGGGRFGIVWRFGERLITISKQDEKRGNEMRWREEREREEKRDKGEKGEKGKGSTFLLGALSNFGGDSVN